MYNCTPFSLFQLRGFRKGSWPLGHFARAGRLLHRPRGPLAPAPRGAVSALYLRRLTSNRVKMSLLATRFPRPEQRLGAPGPQGEPEEAQGRHTARAPRSPPLARKGENPPAGGFNRSTAPPACRPRNSRRPPGRGAGGGAAGRGPPPARKVTARPAAAAATGAPARARAASLISRGCGCARGVEGARRPRGLPTPTAQPGPRPRPAPRHARPRPPPGSRQLQPPNPGGRRAARSPARHRRGGGGRWKMEHGDPRAETFPFR